jgi:hypothetical protein
MADFAAWFRREDYEHIREIMEDSDRLSPSFDEWELLAKSRVANWSPTRGRWGLHRTLRTIVDSWCAMATGQQTLP